MISQKVLATAFEEKHPETGQATGKLSTSRLLSWVFATFSIIILVTELGTSIIGEFWSESSDGVMFGLKSAIMYSVGLGVVSVGFYMNRAGGAFDRVIKVLTGGS